MTAKTRVLFPGGNKWLPVNCKFILFAFMTMHFFIEVHGIGTPPVITVNYTKGASVAKVSEIAAVYSFVVNVKVAGNNVHCGLDDDTFALQSLAKDQHKVLLMKPLDREAKSSYSVTITCRDSGTPPLSASATFNVEVVDENDHAPKFVFPSDKDHTALIPLSVKSAEVIVKAEDEDAGDNAQLTYSILNDDLGDIFSITTKDNKGIIKILQIPSQSEIFSLRIKAEDKGQHPLSSVALLNIEFFHSVPSGRSRDGSASKEKSGNVIGRATYGCWSNPIAMLVAFLVGFLCLL